MLKSSQVPPEVCRELRAAPRASLRSSASARWVGWKRHASRGDDEWCAALCARRGGRDLLTILTIAGAEKNTWASHLVRAAGASMRQGLTDTRACWLSAGAVVKTRLKRVPRLVTVLQTRVTALSNASNRRCGATSDPSRRHIHPRLHPILTRSEVMMVKI